jgi:hypothetical protein
MTNLSSVQGPVFPLIVSHVALAQTQTRLTVGQALDFWITNCEKEVVVAADAMPEEKYSFTPTAVKEASHSTPISCC